MTSEEIALAMVGSTLQNKWTLQEVLGIGGAAAVYRARHRNGSDVAIKVLHAHHNRNVIVRRFLREAKMANRVRHPSVLKVFDDGVTEDGRPFLVTELLDGENLESARVAAGGTLPLEEVRRIAAHVLGVLDVAHGEGVVHRDLKPANLYRTREGGIYVLDFGLARAFEDEESESVVTSLDTTLGTVGFMAPEQAQGRWDLVDARTDLFSLGATCLKLLTGLDVHESKNAREGLLMAATKPAAKVRSRAPSLPKEIAWVLDKSLSFSQRERFANAEEFRRALQSETSESEAPPVSNPAVDEGPSLEGIAASAHSLRAEPGRARWRRPLFSAAAALMLLAGGFALARMAPTSSIEEPPKAASAAAASAPVEPVARAPEPAESPEKPTREEPAVEADKPSTSAPPRRLSRSGKGQEPPALAPQKPSEPQVDPLDRRN